ncbi:MAG TPA: hypothetical protein DEF36_11005 [Desulfotomaculum sp.]|nr:hypothetical protein [Desulfotomaculum sp.]
MFKINSLVMVSYKNEIYTYTFGNGVNYFKGTNDSGKTEFYSFIDYMFGSSQRINKILWFKDTLKCAILDFEHNSISYEIKRTLDKEVNFFRYKDEEWSDPINYNEYKDKLNSIFTIDVSLLKSLRDFTEEDLTYRTFTLFNFLGERALGVLNDFFDKGKDIKYSTKLPSILNYIFNDNLENISNLKKQLAKLQGDVIKLENSINKFDFIKNNINRNLQKLNISVLYTGKNKSMVLEEIESVKSLEETKKNSKKVRTISELETIYNNLNEQIKVYENTIEDNKSFEIENSNRKILLDTFKELISDKQEYSYLVTPLMDIIDNLEKSISFNKYIINSSTINELKKQRDTVKSEISANDTRFTCYDISEKSRSIALIEEYLNIDIEYNTEELERKRQHIKQLKSEIKALQNSDNDEKLTELSDFITNLYKSAYGVSDIIKSDEDIYIQYYKKGNLLQPKIRNSANLTKDGYDNYYIGSMARHTLIQLCGYLGFLHLLIKENKYPLIPILVIDHISKPFDSGNRKAIGIILQRFYETVSVEDLQIFMFDDENHEDLSIIPSHHEDLVTDNKSGFNPFFHEIKIN